MRPIRSFLLYLSLFVLLISAASADGDGAFEAEINTLKGECKALLKDARYEGSKITYYTVGNSKQTKNVEVFMFVSSEYIYAFSTKKCSVPLTIRLYDAAADVEERTLIKEYTNYKGKNFTVSSVELNKIYRKKVPEVERLKNLHIEYSLGTGKSGKEAIVLVMGHR